MVLVRDGREAVLKSLGHHNADVHHQIATRGPEFVDLYLNEPAGELPPTMQCSDFPNGRLVGHGPGIARCHRGSQNSNAHVPDVVRDNPSHSNGGSRTSE